ncbi:MAG: hypothetical protein MR629_04605 [Helicobacter sp.]|nr:hypothetical protein [Helicobacter sp.]MDD7567749.1 hypothetical protein [Helicobacter sp.]MDY5740879.1 hypothetical protein [Helicobacter sp.]
MSDYKTEYTTKNATFFVVFITIVAITITQLLLPQIHAYKLQLSKNKHSRLIFNQTAADLTKLSSQTNSYIAQNKFIFDKLYYNKPLQQTQEELQRYLEQYFLNMKITLETSVSHDELLYTNFRITGLISSNTKLQEMMENLNQLPFVVKLEVPLSIEHEKPKSDLKASVVLQLIQSSYKPHSLVVEQNLHYKP